MVSNVSVRTPVFLIVNVATALLPALGYEGASRLVQLAQASGRTIRETALAEGLLTAEQYAELTSPEAVTRLGSPDPSPRLSQQ